MGLHGRDLLFRQLSMAALIGARLNALLRERGMSQKELAEAKDLTPAAVSRYIKQVLRALKTSANAHRKARQKHRFRRARTNLMKLIA